MEHMYVHSVVLLECVGLLVAIFGKCKLCIQDLELSYMQSSCFRGFTAAKILQNHKLEKEKILYEV